MASNNENDSHLEQENTLREELEVLESIYINELEIEKNSSGDVQSISLQLHPATGDNVDQQYVCLNLCILPTQQYPNELPNIVIKNPRGLAEEHVNSLRQQLHKEAEARRGGYMLYELIEFAKDSLTEANIPHCPCAVCLEPFTADDVFTRTDCYHYFHAYCLRRHVEIAEANIEELRKEKQQHQAPIKDEELQVVCPVCRKPITYDAMWLSGHQAPADCDPAPAPTTFAPAPWLAEQQRRLAELYRRQKEKGGIIDLEEERRKLLLSHATQASAEKPSEEVSNEETVNQDETEQNRVENSKSASNGHNQNRGGRGRGHYGNRGHHENRGRYDEKREHRNDKRVGNRDAAGREQRGNNQSTETSVDRGEQKSERRDYRSRQYKDDRRDYKGSRPNRDYRDYRNTRHTSDVKGGASTEHSETRNSRDHGHEADHSRNKGTKEKRVYDTEVHLEVLHKESRDTHGPDYHRHWHDRDLGTKEKRVHDNEVNADAAVDDVTHQLDRKVCIDRSPREKKSSFNEDDGISREKDVSPREKKDLHRKKNERKGGGKEMSRYEKKLTRDRRYDEKINDDPEDIKVEQKSDGSYGEQDRQKGVGRGRGRGKRRMEANGRFPDGGKSNDYRNHADWSENGSHGYSRKPSDWSERSRDERKNDGWSERTYGDSEDQWSSGKVVQREDRPNYSQRKAKNRPQNVGNKIASYQPPPPPPGIKTGPPPCPGSGNPGTRPPPGFGFEQSS